MKILIVDDDPNTLLLHSTVMSAGGYEVTEASTGKGALEIAAAARPDLILLDVVLPDMSGFEVCRQIKADPASRGCLVVLQSGVSTSSEAQATGLDLGADGFVVKGISNKELLARVHSLARIKEAEDALQRARGELEVRVRERTAELTEANRRLTGAVHQLQTEVELREKAEEALEERLRYEGLLAEISTRFVGLSAERMDTEITDALRRMCEILDIDRSTLWQDSSAEPGTIMLTHIHPVPPSGVPDRPELERFFPWVARELMAGKPVCIGRLADLPEEAATDRETWQTYGTKATLVVPLVTGDRPIMGVLTFASLVREREWSEPLVKELRLVAEVFANALARERSERALRESEARLSLAADSAAAVLWSVDIATGRIWSSREGVGSNGVAADETLTLEGFFKVIHEDDREDVRNRLSQAIEANQEYSAEYRLRHPDGSFHWTVSRGRPHTGMSGKPRYMMGVSLDITDRKKMEAQLEERLREIEGLKSRLETENVYLQQEVQTVLQQNEIVGKSAAMLQVIGQAEKVARTDSTVLILGETGTGKELLARAIHRMSSRGNRVLVTVNCASLPLALMESELFGREKGAYTGALTRMMGRFEVADGSTLFLDEIGELPLELQSKLLRVLEEGIFERLGSTNPIRVNVRIIAATNRDLADDVKIGRFRRDLYYRLNVFPLVIPPLRERPEDIPAMVWAFVTEFQNRMGKRVDSISKKAMDALRSYSWPGNGRELRNVIERAMILSEGGTLEVAIPELAAAPGEGAVGKNLEEMERRHILSVLETTGWRVTGRNSAAEILGLKRSTLQSRMKKLGIERPRRAD